ncbi:thiamine pyrophosphate-binding protein [Mycobacterium persicum]|nr:thiamine pyrophosphate-binding protein [Mycobacterium persicum]ORB51928.1 acetolactate synthase [Mycobacterium persicum]ORB89640.1 acetolactate synthase [Mycobacterium persicum]ORC01825.1 acetolactate synthase [Mycobacterium persicum]
MRHASGPAVTTVGDHLVNRMREAGIAVLCGLPTSRLDSLLVRVARDGDFKIVLTRHEGGAGYLADGYARASGRPAAVFAAGPGATNVVTAVANASVNQVPMLVLTGEVSVPEFGMHSQQDTSEDGLGLGAVFRRLCRSSVSIESVANARSKIDRAFRALASIPSGPVHIGLPRDLVNEVLPVDPVGMGATGRAAAALLTSSGTEIADAVIDRLQRSVAPMLLLGNGCRGDGIGAGILAFCEKAGLPFATTPNGRGVVAETHPLSLGVLGLFGDGRAEDHLFGTPCDLLIAVGVSFDGLVTRSFSPRWSGLRAEVIHVDPDPAAFGRFVATSLGVTATARGFVASLSARPVRSSRPVTVPARVSLPVPPTRGDAIHPLAVMRELDALLASNSTLCTDSGTCIYWAFRGIPVRAPGAFFATVDFAPMGCGVAGAIGMALARPGERVVCIAGDGAFLMHGTEVSTAVAQRLPVTWVVLNDGRLSATTAVIRGRMDPSPLASTGVNDLAAMANALGAQGIRVDNAADLRAGLEKALVATGPCVVDIAIDPELNTPEIGVGK